MRTLLPALALLSLALALRLPRGELAEWKGDEAIQFAHARAIAREHVFPRRGLPTTDGPRLPPYYLYLMAVPVVFRDSPEAIRVFFALASALVCVSAFVFSKKDLGARSALAWAFFLAVLPDEVRRGRWAWHPNLIPLLAALVLLLALRARREERGLAPSALLGLSALLPLIHYALLGVAIFSFFFGLKTAKTQRARLLGAALLLLFLAPHVIQDAGNGFEATLGALSVATKAGSSPERSPLLFPVLVSRAFSLESYAQAAGTAPFSFERPVSLLVLLLLFLGIGKGALSLAKRRRDPQGIALLLALSAWAPFLVLRLPARPHYVQAAFPALACLLGATFGARRSLGLLLLPIGFASVLATENVLGAGEKGLIRAGTDYDLPYREKKRACAELLEKELLLESYHAEYVILLEVAYRELEAERRARFELLEHLARDLRYWDLDPWVPVPKKPRGRGRLP